MYCTYGPRQLGVLEHDTTSFRVADNSRLSKLYSAFPDTALPPWLHAALPVPILVALLLCLSLSRCSCAATAVALPGWIQSSSATL